MNKDRLLEIADGIRKALKAQDSGDYTIGDVRAFKKEDAFVIIEALEHYARMEDTPRVSLEQAQEDDRYIYFMAKIAGRELPELREAIDVRDGICFVDKQLFEVYAFDRKRGRAVRIV